MKLTSPYTCCMAVAALSCSLPLMPGILNAQNIYQPHPLPEAVSIQRKAPASTGSWLAPFAQSSAPTEKYDHGNPTAEEQYILELINRARANPTAEGKMLAEIDDPAILFAYNYFNVNKEQIKSDFAGYPVRPPLAFNSKLIGSARLHSKDMSDNNFQGHTGSNGSTLENRLATASYTGWTGAGENVSAYAKSLIYAHCGFNVDWGVPSLGHRRNIMNFEGSLFTEIGIGIVHDNRPSHTGPIIVTENFGNANKPYIVGVVYNDANGNDFYDIGEGIPNVTITPSGGTYYAVTSESGGYAIPITAQGNMSVTASGGGLGSPITLNTTLGSDNVKLDFNPGLPSLPAQVALVFPSPNAVVVADSVRLGWRAIAGATSYRLQVATDSNFTNLIRNDSTLADTSAMLRSLENGKSYYWRVRAKNEAGWGEFAMKQSFRVTLLPVKTVLLIPPDGEMIPTNNTRFFWKRSSALERAYWFEIASDAAMTAIVTRDTAVTDTFKVVNGLQTNTTYYWRVRTKSDAGWGPYSESRSVRTGVSGVETIAAGAIRLSENIPNPFSGTTVIRFDLATTEDVTLTVSNGLGQQVTTLLSGRFAPDTYEVTWDATGLENGIYYYQLRAGSFIATRKMVLAR